MCIFVFSVNRILTSLARSVREYYQIYSEPINSICSCVAVVIWIKVYFAIEHAVNQALDYYKNLQFDWIPDIVKHVYYYFAYKEEDIQSPRGENGFRRRSRHINPKLK